MEFSWPWRIARKVDESMSNIGGQHTFYRKTLHSVEIINVILMDFPYICTKAKYHSIPNIGQNR